MGDLTLWDLAITPLVVCAVMFVLCWFADRQITRGRKEHR